MDPLIVFDCQKVILNHFALALAAAARARALNRGAGPRINEEALTHSELALHEIASSAFSPQELEPFLRAGSALRLDRADIKPQSGSNSVAAPGAMHPRHTRPLVGGGSLTVKTSGKENDRC